MEIMETFALTAKNPEILFTKLPPFITSPATDDFYRFFLDCQESFVKRRIDTPDSSSSSSTPVSVVKSYVFFKENNNFTQ